MIELSKKGAKIQVESPTENTIPSVSTNLKINLFANHNSSEMSEDIYAKVSKNYSEGNIFYIHFTTKSSSLQEKIDKLFPSG